MITCVDFLIVHLPVDGSSNAQENLKHLVLKYGARTLSFSLQIKGVQELGTSMFVSININEHGGEWANLLYLSHPCRCKTKDLWIADISNKTDAAEMGLNCYRESICFQPECWNLILYESNEPQCLYCVCRNIKLEQLVGEGSGSAWMCVSWKTNRAVIIFILLCSCFFSFFLRALARAAQASSFARKQE